jgi:hypothetical protein
VPDDVAFLDAVIDEAYGREPIHRGCLFATGPSPPGGGQYLPPSIIGPACDDFKHAEVMRNFFKSSK